MKRIIKLFLFFLCITSMYAQTGINTKDPKVSLETEPISTGPNTPEGMKAPQLKKSELQLKDPQYTSDLSGTVIYVTEIDNNIFTPKTQLVVGVGYYYFDGTIWRSVGQAKDFFYLPPFDLKLPSNATTLNIDLYNDVYKKNYVKTGNPHWVSNNAALTQVPNLYQVNELDFVVTHYDPNILTINSISPQGIMNYTIVDRDVYTFQSYITIVVVIK